MADGPAAQTDRRTLFSVLAKAALTVACLAVLGLWCFGGVLFRDRQFAFRDAGHYYYPLYQRVQQEWNAGRWPLWCPEQNGGTPLLGNATAAVLYPGKVVFFLLPYPWAMRLYIVGHVYLAAGSMWLLLRSWGVSATGASLGALAYAFGAPVLSQTCNVIFLVGAAWAPLGFLCADRWLRLGRRGALAGLAVVLALEVVGGDPEAAYVTVICAAAYALGLAAARPPSLAGRWFRRGLVLLVPIAIVLLALSVWSAHARLLMETAGAEVPDPWHPSTRLAVLVGWLVLAAFAVRHTWTQSGPRRLVTMAAGLAGSAILALALAGAQLVPVLEFAAHGHRASAAEADLYHNVYPFSVHPLLLAGSVWPDIYGTTDHGNRSWALALPPKHEDNLWMPSLYLGGLTLIFASSTAGFRGGPEWRAWLTGVALLTLFAALGSYGSPLLWARCVPQWSAALGPLEPPAITRIRADGFVEDGDGSLYWLLAALLPGFATFRYPAKLLVFTALAVSALAGAGWDRTAGAGGQRARRVAWIIMGLSLALLAGTYLGADVFRDSLESLASQREWRFRRLNVPGAIADARTALLQGALVCVAAMSLVAARRWWPRLATVAALAIMTADLGLANARHVLDAPQAAFEGTPSALATIRAAEATQPSPAPFRVQRAGMWWPESWDREGSTDRMGEVVKWERDRLWPNYPLPLGVRSTFVFDTTASVDYAAMLLPFEIPLSDELAASTGLRAGEMVYYYPRRAYDLWGTRYFLVPSFIEWNSLARGYGSLVPRTTQIYPPPGAFSGPDGTARRAAWERMDDVRVLRNDVAFPPAWVVHRARVVPPAGGSRDPVRRKLLLEILYQSDEFSRVPGRPVHDPHLQAWVETDRPRALEPYLSRAEPGPNETVTVTLDSPQRHELTAVLDSPGLAVVAETFYPGWTLTVDGQPAEILRVNRAMRGVALREGTHRLVFEYRPLSFRAGIALSIIGFLALGGLGLWAAGLIGPRNIARPACLKGSGDDG